MNEYCIKWEGVNSQDEPVQVVSIVSANNAEEAWKTKQDEYYKKMDLSATLKDIHKV